MKSFPIVPFKRAVIICLLFVIPLLAVYSQENPFISSPGAKQKNADASESIQLPRNIFPGLSSLQKTLHEKVSGLALSLREEKSFRLTFVLLGLSFLYGFIHALGPGHRKIIITSYLLRENISVFKGIYMAFLVAMLHGVAALAIIGILFFVLHKTVSVHFNAAYIFIERLSYGLIVGLGAYLIIHALRGLFGRKNGGAGPAMSEGQTKKRFSTGIERILFVISNGLVPCPGAALLLILTFAYGLYGLGVTAVLLMSVGMGMLLSVVAAVVLLGKERGLRRVLGEGKGKTVFGVLEAVGSVFVLAFGVVLLLGSF